MRLVIFAGAISLLVSLFGTPLAIRALVRNQYGQLIRDDGPTTHHVKRGTPTMGGGVIILAVIVGYGSAHLLTLTPPSASALLVLGLMTGLGAVGFVDDFIKIRKQRSLGLSTLAKLLGQMLVALVFAVLALRFPDEFGLTPASDQLSFLRDFGPALPTVVLVLFFYLMVAATSNGVNLTDGLDGLATGASIMVFAGFALIGIWQFGQSCQTVGGPICYDVRDPLDLAVVAAACAAACIGFLWWNTSPAQIFMGDTGSLALGGAMAGLAITSRTELLLILLGGLFVLITASVIIQVGFFKLTRRRVFRMAPLQHHFELLGWAEVTVVVRFWILAGLSAAGGLAIFYAEWVVGTP